MFEALKKIMPVDLRARIADFRGRGIYNGYPDQHKCIFIHIPKAAGTSVARTLFGESSRHLHYSDYEQANPRKFADYFKFSFVRNPWSRLFSAYTFLKKGGVNEMDLKWAEANLSRFPDFDSFVKGWVNSENVRSWVHFYPQHYFICDDQLNLKIDFVGRFETIDLDFAHLQKQLGLLSGPLPRINSSARPDSYLEHYSDESVRIVAGAYADDIRTFSYSFGREEE